MDDHINQMQLLQEHKIRITRLYPCVSLTHGICCHGMKLPKILPASIGIMDFQMDIIR